MRPSLLRSQGITQPRWAATETLGNPADSSPPSPPEAEPEVYTGSAPTIADGWFNADPVKITPHCPGSRVSMFVGRMLPDRMHLANEEDMASASTGGTDTTVPFEREESIGLGSFLVNERNKRNDPATFAESWFKEADLNTGTDLETNTAEDINRLPE